MSSPTPNKITHISWGKVIIDGLGEGKDWKLFPGGGREWDWSETGTRHVPGIQPADVLELVEHGCTDIILSRGMELRLQTCAETLDLLKDKSITAHWLETKEAAALYNQLLAEGRPVGALLHSTC